MKSRRTTPALVTIFLVLSILFLWCPFSVASVTGGQTEDPTATDEHIYVQYPSGIVISIGDSGTEYNNATTQATSYYPTDETETSEEVSSNLLPDRTVPVQPVVTDEGIHIKDPAGDDDHTGYNNATTQAAIYYPENETESSDEAVSEDETAESTTSAEEAENETPADETENSEEVSSDSSTSHQATLADAVQILKFLAGVNGDLNSELCDIGGDGKIGIEEAIFCLRAVAGLGESLYFDCSETSTPTTNLEEQNAQSHTGKDKVSNVSDFLDLSATISVPEEVGAVVEDQMGQSHGGADKASVSEDVNVPNSSGLSVEAVVEDQSAQSHGGVDIGPVSEEVEAPIEDQYAQSHAGADKASVSNDVNTSDSCDLSAIITSVPEKVKVVVEKQYAQSHGGADKASVSEDVAVSYSSPLSLDPIDR